MSLCPHCGSSHENKKCPMLESTLLDSQDDPLLGEVFRDTYRIEWRLSVGGVGRVYRATHLPTGLPVAMKVLFASQQYKDEIIRSFEREVEATRELRHQHIVEVYDSGVSSRGERYLVMELLNGEDLGERLLRGALSIADVLEIADQVLSALVYAHDRDVIHRDLKPGNIWLCGPLALRRIHAKLVDFGVARTCAVPDRPRVLLGTPAYMPPEQLRPSLPIDARADLYSLSVTLFELLCARAPYEEDDLPTLFSHILEKPIPSIQKINAEIPKEIEAFLEKGMQKDPSHRFHSAQEMRSALMLLRESLTPVLSVRTSLKPPLSSSLSSSYPKAPSTEIRRVTFVAAEGAKEAIEGLQTSLRDAGAQLYQTETYRVIACFGQKIAYGDEARRAVASALYTRAEQIQIAIASGIFLAHEETKILETVKSLLAKTPPGEVYLDRKTYLLVRGLFKLQQAESGNYLVSGEKPFGLGRSGIMGVETPTVGRTQEIQKILSAVNRVFSGEEQKSLLIVGEAGLGKSRLKLELRRALSVARQPFEYLEGQGDPIRHNLPYSLLSRALRVGDKFLDFSVSAHEETYQAFLAQLQSLTQNAPLFLVLEDLQWADEHSLALIANMLQNKAQRNLFVLGLSRPEAVKKLAGRLGATLKLRLLSKNEVARLVRSIVSSDKDLEAYVAMVSEGNPFLVEEVLQGLRDAGNLVHDGENWHRTAALSAPISVGAQWFLQAQLDTFPLAQKRLLQRASVAGERFFQESLLSLGIDSTALSPLVERGMIEKSTSLSPEQNEFLFRHPLMREVAYSMLPIPERKALHASLARWLTSLPKQDTLTLARHLNEAGEEEAAIPWLREAAEQALKENHPKNAIPHLIQALTLAKEDHDLCFALYLLQEEAFERLGQTEDSRKTLEALEQIAQQTKNKTYQSIVRFRKGRLFLAIGSYEEASELLESGFIVARLAGDYLASCEHLLLLTDIEAALGRYSNALARASQAHKLASSLSRDDLLLASLVSLANTQHRIGDLSLARQYREEAILTARKLEDLRIEAKLLVGLGEICFALGEFFLAKTHLDTAISLSAQRNFFTVLIDAKIVLGRVAFAQNDPETAKKSLKEARTQALEIKDKMRMSLVRLFLAEVLLFKENSPEQAVDTAAEALELATDSWIWVSARTALANAHLARGDLSAALAHARAADEEFSIALDENSPGPYAEPEEILHKLSMIFFHAGHLEDATRLENASIDFLEKRAALISDEKTRQDFLSRERKSKKISKQEKLALDPGSDTIPEE